MDLKEYDYQNEVKVDELDLVNEWKKQAELFEKYSAELLPDAIEIKDKIKDDLDLKTSVLDANIREDPGTFSLSGKVTENAIKNIINQDTEIIKLKEQLIEYNKNVNILNGIIKSFEHKKKALEKLTELWIGGFYAEPKIPKKIDEQIIKLEKGEIRKKLNRKKRND